MEDKTPKTNESLKDETKVESPRQSSHERIADIITASFERAKTNDGILLNATQKIKPAIYDSKMQQQPFNNLLIAMHSDQNDFKTNLVTFFSDAKKRGESVRGGQKGLPISWISWSTFEKKDDPTVKISRSEYMAMPKDEQEKFKGIRNKEMRIVFNIDQTTMPSVNKDAYGKALEQNGSVEDRSVDANTDKQLRIDVNQFILATKDNLVPVRKDGSGIASYDRSADVVHIPAQNAYASYPEYVQDVVRNVVSATAHPQRLNRHSSQNYDTLVTEIASATKLLEFGLPAKLSPKAMENADAIIDMLKKNPKLVDSLERDINSSLTMIQKAQRGEKIELRPTQSEIERWRLKLPKEGTVPDMFDAVLMMKDDNGKWSLYVKPENENGFAVHPDPKDVSMFFNVVKGQGSIPTGQDAENFVANFRKEIAQKYYADVAQNPAHAINLFGTDASKEVIDKIEKVNIFKTKDETPRILMVATVEGDERLKAKELNQDQWQRIWLAPDMKEYKKNLAATMYKEEIAEKFKIDISQSQTKSHEQKAEQKEPINLDVPKWALNYIVNGEAEGLSDEEKDIVDKFLDENFADGFVPEIVEGNDKDFNVSPAFGTRNPNALPNKGESPYQAVETSEVKFYPNGYFERLSESVDLTNTTVVVDNTKEKVIGSKDMEEDKECTKLLAQIDKLEKKCRAETQPNRQREMFLELKDLKGKLDERVALLQKQAEEKANEKATKQETKATTKVVLSPMLKQFLDLKKKHPEALLLFRCGDFYETYKDDAEKASKILGITLTKSSKTKDDEGKPLAMAGFPYHALDTYLPKLIRAGQRVAICDQIEQPKQTASRGVDAVTPNEKQEMKQEPTDVEQQQTRSHGFHR